MYLFIYLYRNLFIYSCIYLFIYLSLSLYAYPCMPVGKYVCTHACMRTHLHPSTHLGTRARPGQARFMAVSQHSLGSSRAISQASFLGASVLNRKLTMITDASGTQYHIMEALIVIGHAAMATYIHECIHTYVHTCAHTYVHTCIHTYNTFMQDPSTHICIHMNTCNN